MRKITLPSGHELEYDLRHRVDARQTSLFVDVAGYTLVAIAKCHPKDQFSRREGRQRVAREMAVKMAATEQLFVTGEIARAVGPGNRKALMMVLCPEFFGSDVVRMMNAPFWKGPDALADFSDGEVNDGGSYVQ